jgi:phosphate transport system permease protein
MAIDVSERGPAPAPRERSAAASDARRALDADRAFELLGAACALLLALVLAVITGVVVLLARPALARFGVAFVIGRTWDPVNGELGALPFVYGTAVTGFLALVLAIPVALGVALFQSDLGPPALRRAVGIVVDLLAAIPSVVYGLWGALVLAPLLRTVVEPALEAHLGRFTLFQGPKLGLGLLCAGLVLAIMVMPTIATVAREVLRAVPTELREAGLALGATRWEVVRRVVIPYARTGLLGAVLLGFGRAVGETMAVAMVIGSRPEIGSSLFSPGYTLASVLANEFASATSELHVAALAELGLILFVLSLGFNVLARLLVARAGASAFVKEGTS